MLLSIPKWVVPVVDGAFHVSKFVSFFDVKEKYSSFTGVDDVGMITVVAVCVITGKLKSK